MNKQPTTPTPTPTQTQKATEPSFYPELTRMRDEVLASAYAEGRIKNATEPSFYPALTRVRDEVLARAYAEGLIKRPKPVTNNHDHEQTTNNNK